MGRLRGRRPRRPPRFGGAAGGLPQMDAIGPTPAPD